MLPRGTRERVGAFAQRGEKRLLAVAAERKAPLGDVEDAVELRREVRAVYERRSRAAYHHSAKLRRAVAVSVEHRVVGQQCE